MWTTFSSSQSTDNSFWYIIQSVHGPQLFWDITQSLEQNHFYVSLPLSHTYIPPTPTPPTKKSITKFHKKWPFPAHKSNAEWWSNHSHFSSTIKPQASSHTQHGIANTLWLSTDIASMQNQVPKDQTHDEWADVYSEVPRIRSNGLGM